ncbi:LOW QUALITY PROTEIN: hypothetical protein ACHAXT_009532 [Thalassiosira profunda]
MASSADAGGNGRSGPRGVSFDDERRPLVSSAGTSDVSGEYDATTHHANYEIDGGGFNGGGPPGHRRGPSLTRHGTLSALSSLQTSAQRNFKVSSLDFERVVNKYSIKAIRRRFLLPGEDDSSSDDDECGNGGYIEDEGTGGEAAQPPRPPQNPKATIVGLFRKNCHPLGVDNRRRALHRADRYSTCILHWLHRPKIMHELVNGWGLQKSKWAIFQTFPVDEYDSGAAEQFAVRGVGAPGGGVGHPGSERRTSTACGPCKSSPTGPLFLVKIIGTILSVSSALSVGQEGPLIHIGAIMGASCTKIGGTLSNVLIRWNARRAKRAKGHRRGTPARPKPPPREPRWTERLLDWTLEELSYFATDAERRDLVSIGASVGFASSFGAPIGGILFILDDISCYFERHLLLRMLERFCLALKHGDLSNYSIISMGTYQTPDDNFFVNRIEEVPLYILVGLAGGLLGGFFSASYLWLRRNITSRFPRAGEGRAKWQLFEVAVVSVLSSLVIFYLPTVSWACKDTPEADVQNFEANSRNVTAAIEATKRFFCPPGQINEMATVMFGSRITAIKDIVSDPSAFQQQTLLSVGFAFYVLTIITFGTAMPSGIFTPTVLIGAALGGACGNAFHHIDPEIAPSTFSLLGVAAALAGVQRSTVSVAVILVEGTGQVKVLIPVIITVIVSRYVAHQIFTLGIFETVIQYKGLPYLPHEHIRRYYDAVQVKEIMSEPPEVLEPRMAVGELVALLEKSNHNGFPIVDKGNASLLWIAALIECGVFSQHQNVRKETDLVAAAYGIQVSSSDANGSHASTPLFHWAYSINDDRYDHVLSIPEEEAPYDSFRERALPLMRTSLDEAHDDLTKEQLEFNKSVRMSLMPAPVRGSSSSSGFSSGHLSEVPQEFCTVNLNAAGNVVISWFDDSFAEYWVDLAAVANRGAYTVPEFCPVSKALNLFTSLGLRHIVVLGGPYWWRSRRGVDPLRTIWRCHEETRMHRIGRSILVGLALFFCCCPGGAHAYSPFDFSSDANAVDGDNRQRPNESNDPAGGKWSKDAPRRITLEEHFWGPDYRTRHSNDDDARTVSLEGGLLWPLTRASTSNNRVGVSKSRRCPTGLFHTCAITYRPGVDGSCGEHPCGPVQCFGHDEFGQASPPSGVVFDQISAGGFHTCGLKVGGKIACWVRLEGSFVQISAGHSFTCGIRPNRKVECWGKNSHSPPSFLEHRFRQISASLGGDHACGVLDDGGIVCWGGNGRGQSDRQEGNYLQVSAGTRTTCAIRDGSDPENGDGGHGSNNHGSNATSIHCWGGRAAAVLDHLEAEPTIEGWQRSYHQQISLGQDHACVSTKSANESLSDTPKTSLECWWMAGSNFDAHRVPAGLEMVA